MTTHAQIGTMTAQKETKENMSVNVKNPEQWLHWREHEPTRSRSSSIKSRDKKEL